MSPPSVIIQRMTTCPNCKTIYQDCPSQCGECGRYLSPDTGGQRAVNMQLMDQVGRAQDENRFEQNVRSPMTRRTGVVDGGGAYGQSTVAAARRNVHKLFEIR